MLDPWTCTVCGTKGGTGKTTLSANLGAVLADLGKRVLLIDADTQPALSSYYEITERAPHGLAKVLETGKLSGCISRTASGCELVISDDPTGELTAWLGQAPDGLIRLKQAVNKHPLFDAVIIDTQGATGPLQDAAVLAADVLLCPIPPTLLSAREFGRGTLSMLSRLGSMKAMGLPLGPLYGVLYMMPPNSVGAWGISSELRRHYTGQSSPPNVNILDTVVPRTIAYVDAATARLPVHRYEKTRRGPRPSGRQTMLALVNELLPGIAKPSLLTDSTQRRAS